ncbi:MAG TPA: hypothetical protein VMB21_04725 [Candidatus Limnocylindria bacterium]|nr:hypothetical protein [Candidatus Limnocylindria bacterium]HTL67229.1 hypothetical protein [Lacunisphaera sp.]
MSKVLAAVEAIIATQQNLPRELKELRQILLDSRQSDALANKEVMRRLQLLGDQSARGAASAAASAALCRRLDCAFDSQLGQVARLSSQVEVLQRQLQESWLQRQRATWAAMCRDTRGISREEWLAARRMFIRGARANRWLWRGTMMLLLIALLLAVIGRAP